MSNEELFCRLARAYAEKEGAKLRQELSAENAASPTPGLDKKLRRGLFRLQYKVHLRVVGTVAACLALALLLPPILQQPEPGAFAPQPQMAAPVPAAGALPEEAEIFGDFARIDGELDAHIAPAGDAGVAFEMYSDQLPEPPLPSPRGEDIVPFAAAGFEETLEVEWNASEADLPPLSFELPEGFGLTDAFRWFDGTGSSYIFSFGRDQTIGLNIDYQGGIGLGFDSSFAEDNSLFNRMQLHGHTIYYDHLPERSRAALVIFTKGDEFYHISGCPYTTLEDLLLLAEAIIAG